MMVQLIGPGGGYDRDKHDERALALWCSGRNTDDIARKLGVPEWAVALAVPRLLFARRLHRAAHHHAGVAK